MTKKNCTCRACNNSVSVGQLAQNFFESEGSRRNARNKALAFARAYENAGHECAAADHRAAAKILKGT